MPNWISWILWGVWAAAVVYLIVKIIIDHVNNGNADDSPEIR